MSISGRLLCLGAKVVTSVVMNLFLCACAQPWDRDTDSNFVACRSTYGFPPGSPNFEKCMQRLKEIDAKNRTRALFKRLFASDQKRVLSVLGPFEIKGKRHRRKTANLAKINNQGRLWRPFHSVICSLWALS